MVQQIWAETVALGCNLPLLALQCITLAAAVDTLPVALLEQADW
jgi:hypothetical protein